MKRPILISFYTSQPYYAEAAARLAAQCDALSISHDIVEMRPPAGAEWDAICRMKCAFIASKLRARDRPVLWVDVDTELLARPDLFDAEAGPDFAAFGRNFKSARAALEARSGRMFAPSILFFNATDAGRAFAEAIERFERACPLRVTDDYVLEECWRDAGLDLDVRLFSSDRVVDDAEAPATGRAWFRFGRSGEANAFIGKVAQHRPDDEARAETRAFIEEADDAARNGDAAFAQKLLRRARRRAPTDDAVFLAWAESAVRLGPEHSRRAADAGARRLNALLEREDARAAGFADGLFDILYRHEMPAFGLEIAERLAANKLVGASARCFSPLFEADLRAEALGFAAAQRAPVWRRLPRGTGGGLGDALTPWLIEGVAGAPPRHSNRPADGLALGAVLPLAEKDTPVWGSGAPAKNAPISPEARYFAVRGPKSRDLVTAAGGKAPDVIGDPALLAPRRFRPDVATAHDFGVILRPGHGGPAPPEQALTLNAGVAAQGDIEGFIRRLLSCRAIVSSSLYGIILAHAYGRPAVWLAAEADEERRFEFEDYFASIGISNPPMLRWRPERPLDRPSIEACLTQIAIAPDLDALEAVCPFRPTDAGRALPERPKAQE